MNPIINLKPMFLELARASGKYSEDTIAEYVNEAEHQDGEEYWIIGKYFFSVEQALYDLKIYVESLD
jgi:hypothetical protein